MDFSVTNFPSDQIALAQRAARSRAYGLSQNSPSNQNNASPVVINNVTTNGQPSGTRLVNETTQDIADGGYRRTRTYEREDGRTFTKIEEFALTDRGARKSVIQQNPSGSITRYEEILDRESGGNFRRTQRFQDGTGEISTNITPGYKVTDPFILTGGDTQSFYAPLSPFDSDRGLRLDIQA